VLLEWVKFAIGVLYLVHMGFPVYRGGRRGLPQGTCLNPSLAQFVFSVHV